MRAGRQGATTSAAAATVSVQIILLLVLVGVGVVRLGVMMGVLIIMLAVEVGGCTIHCKSVDMGTIIDSPYSPAVGGVRASLTGPIPPLAIEAVTTMIVMIKLVIYGPRMMMMMMLLFVSRVSG